MEEDRELRYSAAMPQFKTSQERRKQDRRTSEARRGEIMDTFLAKTRAHSQFLTRETIALRPCPTWWQTPRRQTCRHRTVHKQPLPHTLKWQITLIARAVAEILWSTIQEAVEQGIQNSLQNLQGDIH